MESKNLNQWENKIGDVVTISEQREIIMHEIESLRNSKEKVIGIKTGFNKLDTVLSGLQKRNFVLLSGRSGVGKTGFILNIAKNICKDNHSIMYFSLDLSTAQLIKRLIANLSEISNEAICSGKINDEEFKKVNDAALELDNMKLFVYENSTISLDELRSKYLRFKDQKPDIIIIDYLQCMSVKGKKLFKESSYLYDRQEWVELSNGLKQLSRDLNVPVIGLTNIERVNEDTDSSRLSDSSELNILEQDADVLLLMSLDNSKDDFKYTDVIIAKNKNGNTGTIKYKYKYDNLKSRFYEEQYSSN